MTTLDELRRANLREQRRSADERLAPKEPAAAAPVLPAVADSQAAEKATPVLVPAEQAPVIPPVTVATPLAKSAPPAAQMTEMVVAPSVELVPAPSAEIVVLTPPVAGNGAHSATNPSHAVPGAVPPADVATVMQTENLVDRVHLALARKVIHPTGVKATVDMPPDLFWRLKRYCRDHNNVTVRQVFLDLMIAYLDEEGY